MEKAEAGENNNERKESKIGIHSNKRKKSIKTAGFYYVRKKIRLVFAFWYFRHCCYYCCCRCCCMLENIMNEHSVWARVPRALLGKLPHTQRHTSTRFHNVHTKCLPLANTLCHWCECAHVCAFVCGGLRGNVQNMEHGKFSPKKNP